MNSDNVVDGASGGTIERGEDPLENKNLNIEQELYRENILDHYKHPHNKRILENPTITRAGKNPLCGDAITVQLIIDGDIMNEIAFSGTGCAVSQAAISMLSDELVGKNTDEIMHYMSDDIVKLLGIPIGPVRLKCALLGLQTIQEAINESKKLN